MRKYVCVLLVATFSLIINLPSYGDVAIHEYLCEIGIQFYNEGRIAEALQEFNKALLVVPNYKPALIYIRKIEQAQTKEIEVSQSQETQLSFESTRALEIQQALSTFEGGQVAITQKPKLALVKKILPPKQQPLKMVALDELSDKFTGSLEVEQGKSLILYASGIQRYLITDPAIIKVERKDPQEIIVTGNNIGYTYLHVWEEGIRKTLEVLTLPVKPEGETLEDIMRLEQEKAGNFKLGYSLDWSNYSTGSGFGTLKRSNYYYVHNLSLAGETPYGVLDSALSVNRFNKKTDLSHYTLGLSDGKFGDFKNFTLRGFDFFDFPPDFSNLSFPGIPLRGVMGSSPAFNNKLNYTAFYGKENSFGYASLSPDLLREKKAYQEGFNIGLNPTPKQDYHFTLVRGWGRDRDPSLKPYGYDAVGNWLFNNWKFGYEIANDTEESANLLSLHYVRPNLNFDAQLRDIDRNFTSITGNGWDQGQLGGLFNFHYKPVEKLDIYSSLDVYKDRQFPSDENNITWNEDFNWNSVYRLNPLTSLSMNYILQNELGRISQYRYQSIGSGINHTFKFLKDINLFLNYYHQENTNFSSPVSSYGNERVYAGMKFNFTRDLYYYANQEINWLREKATGNRSMPRAFETGVDWSFRFGKSPFWGASRFTYRNEEDTESNLSFLSGEDYIEGYSEFSYRPNPSTQAYASCRIRNVWADNSRVNKRIEANFNAGLRILWDTGFSWQAVGDIEGYVFKDYNGDGMMQRNEPPIEGVKVWLGKNRYIVTDMFGYYKFKKVRGNQVYINLDTATVPSGFVLTVPASQPASIVQHGIVRVDFGMNARSEIFGYVFEDVNGDGQFGKEDKGVRKAVVMLENGVKRLTDAEGKYSFSNVSPGNHDITLDLNSIPIYYLPKVALVKKITLSEGVAYNYNIPLKKSEE